MGRFPYEHTVPAGLFGQDRHIKLLRSCPAREDHAVPHLSSRHGHFLPLPTDMILQAPALPNASKRRSCRLVFLGHVYDLVGVDGCGDALLASRLVRPSQSVMSAVRHP